MGRSVLFPVMRAPKDPPIPQAMACIFMVCREWGKDCFPLDQLPVLNPGPVVALTDPRGH